MGKRGQPQRRIHRQHLSTPQQNAAQTAPKAEGQPANVEGPASKDWILLILFWGYVLLPLAWGIASTAQKALLLFK